MTTLLAPETLPPSVAVARPRPPVARRAPDALIGPLLALATTGIALVRIGGPSFWFDEAFSVNLARVPSRQFWQVVVSKEANQSAYFLLLRWWPFHGGEFGVRSLSALLAGATAPLVWGIGRRLFDERTGLLAAALFAALPFSLQAAQEARGYSLLMLVAAAAGYALVRATTEGGRWWWACAALAGLLPYVHFFGLFILAAQAVWLVSDARNRRRGLLCLAVASVLASPMLVFFAVHHDAQQVAWLHRPDGAALTGGLDALGTRPWAGGCVVALALAGLVVAARRARRTALLLGLWLVVAPALTVAYSLAVTPIYQVRYLAGQAPALALLMAVAIGSPRDVRLRRPLAVAVVTGLLVLTRGHHGPLVREDWRGADALLRQYFRAGDQVMTFPSYLAPGASVYGVGSYGEVDDAPRPASAARVWVLSLGRRMPTPIGYDVISARSTGGVELMLLARVTPPAIR